ncbi:MAG: hypothetical protein HY047_19540, partial [Acidobacteria bacterium]|nr:hypothetical protein [Acidobacteriota bacterium]
RLSRGSPGARWMVEPARRWLALWTRTFGVDGFNPFDTLAVARVASPAFVTCDVLPARIEVLPDDVTEARMQGTTAPRKPYLLVSRESQSSSRPVEYCYSATDAFKPDLLERLTARGR